MLESPKAPHGTAVGTAINGLSHFGRCPSRRCCCGFASFALATHISALILLFLTAYARLHLRRAPGPPRYRHRLGPAPVDVAAGRGEALVVTNNRGMGMGVARTGWLTRLRAGLGEGGNMASAARAGDLMKPSVRSSLPYAPCVCPELHVMGSGRPRVLLVEDMEINRVVVRRLASEVGLALEEAENGLAAVEICRQGRSYDIILMDKDMPVMDGHEATRQLRALGVTTPIVALSGDSLPLDQDLFFEAGANDFQTKPISKAELVRLLARYGLKHD